MTTLSQRDMARLARIERQLVELSEAVKGLHERVTLREALAEYAHTPDEMESVLEASRTGKRLIVRRGRVVGLI